MATHVIRRQPGAQVAGKQSPAENEQVVRFDVHQRLQHFLMMSSFIVLALTGLPQKFSELGISQWWVAALGGLENVRTIHHVAAFVMLGDCAYHLAYLTYRIGVQRRFGCFRMVPTLKDLNEARQMLLYYLGRAAEKPQFDRFNYLEKFDYWAVFWGIVVIGGSGLVLLFPVAVANVAPGQAIRVALTLHTDEALLATGWILIMHMFNAHLAPWVFPFNPAIFTGKLSAKHYAEDHPAEWAQMQAEKAAEAPAMRAPSPERRRVGPIEGVTRCAIAVGGVARRKLTLASVVGTAWVQKPAGWVGTGARVMRAREIVVLMVVGGLLLAGWSSGGGIPHFLEANPPPATSLVSAPHVEATPTPAVEPTPQPMTHRQAVLERFPCENCHRVDSGWRVPADHADMQEQTCNSCHAPAPEPSPVAVHHVPGDIATGELCTLCHGDMVQQNSRPLAPQVAAPSACATCHNGDQRAEPPADHSGRSVTTCSLCHESRTVAASAVPHTVEGWQECSFCHGGNRLAPMKGGHKDLQDNECLGCHDAVPDPPRMPTFMQLFSLLKGGCTGCHGEGLGPMPSDHTERSEVMCALCHTHPVPHSPAGQDAYTTSDESEMPVQLSGHAGLGD